MEISQKTLYIIKVINIFLKKSEEKRKLGKYYEENGKNRK